MSHILHLSTVHSPYMSRLGNLSSVNPIFLNKASIIVQACSTYIYVCKMKSARDSDWQIQFQETAIGRFNFKRY